MTIEATLESIDTSLKTLVQLVQNSSGVAGAGADPTVAQQVNKAIAAATPVPAAAPAAPARGRGRPRKTEQAPAAVPTEAAPAPAPAQPVASAQPDPFALDTSAPSAPAEKPRTLDEVRAALAVYQAMHSQAAAIELFRNTTGVETLAQLKPEAYSKLFRAAIPADKLTLSDVRAVLVAAEQRKAGEGLAVLKRFGAAEITKLPEERFVEAILAAHAVR